jgi:S1-C subfamily serine protease
MESDDTERPQGVRHLRRFHTRIALAALIVVVPATVAAGLALASTRSPAIGTGFVVIDTNLAYQGEQAAGTGMVLTSSGEVLTNNHVIRGATTVKVVVPATGRSYSASVVGYDVSDDVAVLQASGASNLKTASLGSSSTVDVGEPVKAVGNAGGTGRLTSASGTVTGLARAITVNNDQGGSERLTGLIETNAAVRPGDSGGPLLNAGGQVVGMDTAASVGSEGQQPAMGMRSQSRRRYRSRTRSRAATSQQLSMSAAPRSSASRSERTATGAQARWSHRSYPVAPQTLRASSSTT